MNVDRGGVCCRYRISEGSKWRTCGQGGGHISNNVMQTHHFKSHYNLYMPEDDGDDDDDGNDNFNGLS